MLKPEAKPKPPAKTVTPATPEPEVAEPAQSEAVTPEPAQPGDEISAGSKLQWPVLNLTAIVGRGVTGSAIINGEILSVGESIEDVTLVIIGDQGVEIEFQGRRRTLKVGQSTY